MTINKNGKTLIQLVGEALQATGTQGATPAEMAKSPKLRNKHLRPASVSGALSALWRKGLAHREEAPKPGSGATTHRYFWLETPTQPRPKSARRKSGGAKKPAGAAGLLDTLTDYLAQDRHNRERVARARELIVQALALLTLPEDPLLQEQMEHDSPNDNEEEPNDG